MCGTVCVALGLWIFVASAQAATPVPVFINVTQPVGVAASQSAVFVAQPFCVNDSQTGKLSPSVWQILKFDTAGNRTVFSVLPSNPDYGVIGTPNILSNCQETDLAISTGSGGFPIGHVYATQGGHIYEFDRSGLLVMHGVSNSLAFIPSLEVPFAHTSLTLDTIGSFGGKMLVVGTNATNQGEIWSVDSTGVASKLFTLTGPFAGGAACNGPLGVPCFESPDVAPLSGPIGATFPGSMFLPLPGFSGSGPDIGALTPANLFSTPGTGVAQPESVRVIPPAASSCGFALKGQTYEYFTASFSATGNGNGGTSPGNTIFAYKSSDFAGLDGQLLVNTEGGNPGVAVSTGVSAGPVVTYTAFDPLIYNSEGSALVRCVIIPPPPVGQSVTVDDFVPATLDSVHRDSLQQKCDTLIQNGSGAGVCTCGVGDNAFVTGESDFAKGVGGFRVGYYDLATSVRSSAAGYGGPGFSGGAGDATVRIINPTAEHGNLCALIYVFDDNEELQTCCGCPVTPDGMRTLSVLNDLTLDFGVNKGNLTAGVIDVISSEQNFDPGVPPLGPNPPGTNGHCSPTGLFSSGDLFHRAKAVEETPGLDIWITHDEIERKGRL
jgi:hypothetical protein